MTIKELYIFAINNSLLDEEVSIVVSKYHEKESKVIQPIKSLDLNKVESGCIHQTPLRILRYSTGKSAQGIS